MNLRLRKLFIGGLHKSINNRKLYNLFRQEGRILGWKVFYDRNGYSRGFGVLEFDRPRDAWKTIQKWNNTPYMGYNLRIEYKNNSRRRMNRNRRNFNANNKGSYRKNRGFNYGKNNNYQNTVRNVKNNFKGVEVSPPQGTYMIYVDCTNWCKKHNKTIEEVEKAAWKVGVALQDGRMFNGPFHLRLNLALPLSKVKDAFDRLDKYVFNIE